LLYFSGRQNQFPNQWLGDSRHAKRTEPEALIAAQAAEIAALKAHLAQLERRLA
jgi:hypothetical protein